MHYIMHRVMSFVQILFACGWASRLYGRESIFRFSHTKSFIGKCFYGADAAALKPGLIKCRWVYVGQHKKPTCRE